MSKRLVSTKESLTAQQTNQIVSSIHHLNDLVATGRNRVSVISDLISQSVPQDLLRLLLELSESLVHIDDLAPEILYSIFSKLPATNVRVCLDVCKTWRRTIGMYTVSLGPNEVGFNFLYKLKYFPNLLSFCAPMSVDKTPSAHVLYGNIKFCTKLKILNLADAPKLGTSLTTIARSCTNLEQLMLGDVGNRTFLEKLSKPEKICCW
eukprot:TRINITY_DN10090_c0_g1_i8.p1 TRINITY_DN10090_c0_g1~~TRINITY_DN10090_c0_g1_i8.p1  ORF type:complete len:207 (+),score=22.13 TRINITY_DN10090_c0_g1_i8:81-701(+)